MGWTKKLDSLVEGWEEAEMFLVKGNILELLPTRLCLLVKFLLPQPLWVLYPSELSLQAFYSAAGLRQVYWSLRGERQEACLDRSTQWDKLLQEGDTQFQGPGMDSYFGRHISEGLRRKCLNQFWSCPCCSEVQLRTQHRRSQEGVEHSKVHN